MAGKYYVIAGNRSEYTDWKRRNCVGMLNDNKVESLHDIVYVHSVDSIRGVSNPQGIFIGTWYNRIDIDQILNQLTVAMNDTNKLEPIKKAWAYLESKAWMEVT